MKSVKVSDEVWDEIAKKGKFGETEDDVLRRVLNLAPLNTSTRDEVVLDERPLRTRIAKQRISPKFTDDRRKFFVQLEDGRRSNEWILPSRYDKRAIRKVTYDAMKFASESGATQGQVLAVRKALTEAGYHLTK